MDTYFLWYVFIHSGYVIQWNSYMDNYYSSISYYRLFITRYDTYLEICTTCTTVLHVLYYCTTACKRSKTLNTLDCVICCKRINIYGHFIICISILDFWKDSKWKWEARRDDNQNCQTRECRSNSDRIAWIESFQAHFSR